MEKMIKDKHGHEHRIGLYCYPVNGKVSVWINNVEHHLKVYYRPERTWDDHMGNTPCGDYVTIPLSDGERKRIYLKYR